MVCCAPETQARVPKAQASLSPLTIVHEKPSDFAEGLPDFLVEVGQGICMQVGRDHPHIVGDLANSGAVPEQPCRNLRVIELRYLIKETAGSMGFILGVGIAKSFVVNACT